METVPGPRWPSQIAESNKGIAWISSLWNLWWPWLWDSICKRTICLRASQNYYVEISHNKLCSPKPNPDSLHAHAALSAQVWPSLVLSANRIEFWWVNNCDILPQGVSYSPLKARKQFWKTPDVSAGFANPSHLAISRQGSTFPHSQVSIPYLNIHESSFTFMIIHSLCGLGFGCCY